MKTIFNKYLPKAYGLVGISLILSSCQLGPFYYTLERDGENRVIPGSRQEITHEGYHGAFGNAYRASMEAGFLARDLTDEELDGANDYPGKAYDNSEWCGANPNEVAMQHVFVGENGELFILEDDGQITEI